MKIDDIAKQLANKENQEHYIKHYLEKVQRGAYNKGVKDTEAKQLILSGVVTSKRDETLELLEEIIIKVKEADNEVDNGIYDPMLEVAKHILNNYKIERRQLIVANVYG